MDSQSPVDRLQRVGNLDIASQRGGIGVVAQRRVQPPVPQSPPRTLERAHPDQRGRRRVPHPVQTRHRSTYSRHNAVVAALTDTRPGRYDFTGPTTNPPQAARDDRHQHTTSTRPT
ncbi:hypothetical protein GCM10009676_38980 [Prauserella halophila]|uniref:Uncharacterized protein n=1 Tax=Prauserella halophila TaxID=185641 RepID=A0ABP4H3U2_9PSEU